MWGNSDLAEGPCPYSVGLSAVVDMIQQQVNSDLNLKTIGHLPKRMSVHLLLTKDGAVLREP